MGAWCCSGAETWPAVATAFNLGPAAPGGGTVSITRDVAIRGEVSSTARTTIQGGFIPLLGEGRVRMSLVNVRFVAPAVAALVLHASMGAVIVDNEVAEVVGRPTCTASSRVMA